MAKGYYNEKNLDKFTQALRQAFDDVRTGRETRVRISNANSKMGNVASVSGVPFLTCPESCKGTCGPRCYAGKLAALRPVVLRSYCINVALYTLRPNDYWQQVNEAIAAVRYFRYNVAGDIPSGAYFGEMISSARRNPGTEILCFTKRFDIVNRWIDENGSLPENLHLLFSGWTNLTPDNPHNLPETNVIERGAEPDPAWKLCGGNCFNCACRGVGCWQAQPGDVIAFHIH